MNTTRHAVCHTRGGGASAHATGFSLIELLVTVVLAGIVFLAMVPLFVSALKTTSTNSRRVIATNVAQARIEKIRMLGASMGSTTGPTGFAAITSANMNSSTFDGGLFAGSYTPAGGGSAYTINTTVSTDATTAPYKTVTVTVTRAADNFQTKVSTVVQNPTAVTTSSTSGPGGGSGPFSLTVAFKNYTEVTSAGVTVVYVNSSPTPKVTTTATPTKQVPSASSTTVTWTNLPGGPNYLYTVTCHNTSSASPTETAPVFHLFSNGWIKFDTNPGGS